jgi:HEAT repeat protein
MATEEERLHDEGQATEHLVIRLLTALTSDNRVEATQATMALYRLRDPQAVPPLITALSAPERHVRAVAAGVLGELQDRRAVRPLIDALEHAEDELYDNAGVAAAHSLGKLGDPQAVDALIRALERPNLDQAAVDALGRLGDRRAVEPLIAYMRRTKNPSGATVLGNFGDHRAVEPLLTELATIQEPRPTMGFDRTRQDIYFYYVIRALGKLGDSRAVPLLAWISDYETNPVLKGKSLSDMASRALQRIHEGRPHGA